MEIVKVKLKDFSTLQFVECPDHIIQELSDLFTFEVPNAKFMPAVRKRRWDGKIRLLNRNTNTIDAGLFYKVREYVHNNGNKLVCIENKYGIPGEKEVINYKEFSDWLQKIPMKYELRDYQYKAIAHAIKHRRAVLISPTGSGKSFIIYLTILWYLVHKAINEKVLIVVPTTSLVEQFYKDLDDYGMDVEQYCQKIYSGYSSNPTKKIVISTWQSIYQKKPSWFHEFGMVVGDECHQFKAKSLSSIMNKSINAKYRLGYTGSLDGSEISELSLEGLFGPIRQVAYTRDLQEEGYLAPLNIRMLQLQYQAEHRRKVHNVEYFEEIDYIIGLEIRNNFIKKLALSLEGNTLILFNYVEKHGHVLRDLIKSEIEDGRKLLFVAGETKTDEREAIRAIMEKQTNAILLASYGTFSTGVNIRNIHNIIFASPSRSQVRVLQSIGRGLRLSDNGRNTRLFDISDDLAWKKKPNITLKHATVREGIYKKEGFDYDIVQLELK